MESTRWTSLAEALRDLDFPATRQQIVDHALDTRADHGVLLLIRELPATGTFPDVQTVCSTVAGDAGPIDGPSSRHRAD